MKKFLFSILYFISFPIALVVLSETGIYIHKKSIFSEENLGKVFSDKYKAYNWMSKLDTAQPKSLLTGSSTVHYGISCNILNEQAEGKEIYCNLGSNARDPIEIFYVLKKINYSSIKKVYVGIDPWIYAKAYYLNRPEYYYNDFNFKEAIMYSLEHDKACLLKRYFSYFAYLFNINSYVNQSVAAVNKIPEGFGSELLRKAPKNFDLGKKDWFQLEKYGWSALELDYLKKVMDLCNERGWGISFILPPKRSDFCGFYQEHWVDIHKSFISEIKKRGINQQIYGFYDNYPSEKWDCFGDPFHLNVSGQEEYSKSLYQLLLGKSEKFGEGFSWVKKSEF